MKKKFNYNVKLNGLGNEAKKYLHSDQNYHV